MTNENDNLPTVLIVDDVPTNVKILADALRAEYRIKVATNGPGCPRAAQSQLIPDLVLLDVMMPAMDGYEVCRELKRAPETQRIPVVFVTAKDTDFDEEFGFGLGYGLHLQAVFAARCPRAQSSAIEEVRRLGWRNSRMLMRSRKNPGIAASSTRNSKWNGGVRFAKNRRSPSL